MPSSTKLLATLAPTCHEKFFATSFEMTGSIRQLLVETQTGISIMATRTDSVWLRFFG
jgi:hypothetical protein